MGQGHTARRVATAADVRPNGDYHGDNCRVAIPAAEVGCLLGAASVKQPQQGWRVQPLVSCFALRELQDERGLQIVARNRQRISARIPAPKPEAGVRDAVVG